MAGGIRGSAAAVSMVGEWEGDGEAAVGDKR